MWYKTYREHSDHKFFKKLLNTLVFSEERTAMLCGGGRHAPNWRLFPERNEVTDFIKFHITIKISFIDFSSNWINEPCMTNCFVKSLRSKVFSVFGKKLGQRCSERSQYKEFSVASNKGTKERKPYHKGQISINYSPFLVDFNIVMGLLQLNPSRVCDWLTRGW